MAFSNPHLIFLQGHVRGAVILYRAFKDECAKADLKNGINILLLLDAYIVQLGRICNLLEPSRQGAKYQKSVTRGAALRRHLNLADGALNHIRSIRNRVEHIDEDIDAYLETGPSLVIQVVAETDKIVAQIKVRSDDRLGIESLPFRSFSYGDGTFSSGDVSVSIPSTLADLYALSTSISGTMIGRQDNGAREWAALHADIEKLRSAYADDVSEPLRGQNLVLVS